MIRDRRIGLALGYWGLVIAVIISSLTLSCGEVMAQSQRSQRSVIRGGVIISADELRAEEEDSVEGADSLAVRDTLAVATPATPIDSLDSVYNGADSTVMADDHKWRLVSDSMSLSRMCWTSVALPGFGQIYNRQYWKLPIFYGAIATGATLFARETKRYKPLKSEYDDIIATQGGTRTEYLDELQTKMIRSNTRRQLYLGTAVASYIYALGDAAVNYATNDVSDVKKATTLATICPGAGQIFNKQYWKVPFVVGGFATMIYVVDWNNRGYTRFNRAYQIMVDYEKNPEAYPNGSPDEFGGRYNADYMKSLRDSYRRNRDLSIIMLAGLYILQIVDAHVDAHFKDFDIADDLTMNIEPSVGYQYSPSTQSDKPTFGFNVGVKF